jgi:hypothetical protein
MTGRKTFYEFVNLGYAICWNRLNPEMHLILIGANLQEFRLISFFYFQTDFFPEIIHLIIKYCTPILGRKY